MSDSLDNFPDVLNNLMREADRLAPQLLHPGDAIRRGTKLKRRSNQRHRVEIGLVIAAALIVFLIPLPQLHLFSGGAQGDFQAASSLLPPEAPLDQSILISPAGMEGMTSGGTVQPLTVIDPADGLSRSIQPFAGDTLESFPWVASGDEVIAVNGLQHTKGVPQVGTAVAFAPEQPGSINTLGRASYVVDGSTAADVWLVVNPDFEIRPQPSDSGCTVEEVTLRGRILVPARPFPCGWTIDGSAPAELLVTRAGIPSFNAASHGYRPDPATLSVWDPRSGLVMANYSQASTNLHVDGTTGRLVLWNECGSGSCARDNLTDLGTGRTSVVIPKLSSGWLANSDYVLSPDGSFVAIVAISRATRASLNSGSAISGPGPYFGVRAVASELFVYNLRTNSLVESRSLMAASDVLVRWSADNGYLFLTQDLKDIEAVPLWSDVAPIRVMAAQGAAESFLPLAKER